MSNQTKKPISHNVKVALWALTLNSIFSVSFIISVIIVKELIGISLLDFLFNFAMFNSIASACAAFFIGLFFSDIAYDYMCDYCNKKFRTIGEMHEHVLAAHAEDVKRDLGLSYCAP